MSCSRARQLAASFALLSLVLCTWLGNAGVEGSIEKEPVRVTHRNSGPRYDIDEVERTRLNAEASENLVIPPASRPSSPAPDSSDQKPTETSKPGVPEEAAESERGEPIGHITIRRIFMVPMAAPSSDVQGEQAGEQHSSFPLLFPFLRPASHEHDQQQSPSESGPHLFGRRPHLFGADEASRPQFMMAPRPQTPTGDEREMLSSHSNERPERPLIDPLQMMIQMMHQALNPEPNGGGDIFGDLSKDGSANRPQQDGSDQKEPEQPNSSSDAADKPKTELESTTNSKPLLTRMKNETREDVVEIDGKKFLRKSVSSKHVGDNVVFMTKRLIFTPLNETATPTTGESTAAPEISRPSATNTDSSNLGAVIHSGQPESNKTGDEALVATIEPASVLGALPRAELTTEMPSIPTIETKPSNPETLPAEPESVPAKISTPAPAPASEQANASERPSIPNQSNTTPNVTKEEPESRKIDEDAASAATSASGKSKIPSEFFMHL